MQSIQPSFFTIQEIANIFQVGKTTVWNWCNPKSRQYKADFPKPYKLGGNTTRWKAAEIQAHIDSISHERTTA